MENRHFVVDELELRRVFRAAGLLGAVLAGCAAPTDPPPPPSGGEEYVLSFERFVGEVEPVLRNRGCGVAGDCHGGGIRGTYALSPPDAMDPQFDFEQSRLQVTPYDPQRSPLLLKPLAQDAGGAPHSFEPFASSEDSGFVAISDWILSGEFR